MGGRWWTPRGNLSVGAVVSQSLKSLWGLVICSRIFSRVLSQLGRRWQFWSMHHKPRMEPVSSISAAFGPIPWPSAMYLSLAPGL